jgi:hypothetical protein
MLVGLLRLLRVHASATCVPNGKTTVDAGLCGGAGAPPSGICSNLEQHY